MLAVDLPGYGRSAPLDHHSSEALAAAVGEVVPARPALASHSLGGLVLAHAVGALRPELAVYEDPVWSPSPEPAVVQYFRDQKGTLADLEREHPRWSDRNRRNKLDALSAWDPGIVDNLGTSTPAPVETAVAPSLLVLANPSRLARAPAQRNWCGADSTSGPSPTPDMSCTSTPCRIPRSAGGLGRGSGGSRASLSVSG